MINSNTLLYYFNINIKFLQFNNINQKKNYSIDLPPFWMCMPLNHQIHANSAYPLNCMHASGRSIKLLHASRLIGRESAGGGWRTEIIIKKNLKLVCMRRLKSGKSLVIQYKTSESQCSLLF